MRLEPYGALAPWYDLLSGERLVYRAGRLAALRLLRLPRGAAVLDLGCGTGLNLPLLARAVGPGGLLVGLDRSPQMLAQAARRPAHGWPTVRLIEADATDPRAAEQVRAALRQADRAPAVDAVVTTYALSVVADPGAAWRLARSVLAPRGQAAIVDMRLHRGPLRPLAAAAMHLGGADPGAEPWRPLQREGSGVRSVALRGGHVQVAVGRLDRAQAAPAGGASNRE